MITIIAIALFTILCPCVSYIIVKRKVFPWNGGLMLVKEDGGLIAADFESERDVGEHIGMPGLIKRQQAIGIHTAIKGLYLPGATNSLPLISFSLRDDRAIFYHFEKKSSGVYLWLNSSLNINDGGFGIIIDSKNEWNGCDPEKSKNGSYVGELSCAYYDPQT
jgi:hypothetical protein